MILSSEEYSLKQLSSDVDLVVRKYVSESETLLHLKPLLETAVNTSSLPAEAFAPRKDRFAMNLLSMPDAEAYSIIGGGWRPAQSTPLHAQLTWASIGEHEGAERGTVFTRIDDG